jgi:glycosyltransferase involved in cell wall biosynthesis
MITFCLISCGEETEGECRKAIEPHLDKIKLQTVRNVTPQIAALNRMIEQADTEYLVPLDADIVLFPDFYERIVRAIEKHQDNPQWHSILFRLHDTLTDEEILALKVLRTEVMKRYPFEDVPTPDVEHFERLTKAGFICIQTYLNKPPIGRHIVRGAHLCYHKYRDVYMSLRTYDRVWDASVFKGGETLLDRSKNHFDYFAYKWLTTDNSDYLWCIAGMYDGLTIPLNFRSKDLSEPFVTHAGEAIDKYLEWHSSQEIFWGTAMF